MAGADRVVAMDLHAGQLQGFFNIPVDLLLAIFVQAQYFGDLGLKKDVVVVAPDHNGVKGARNLAQLLKAPIAIVDKRGTERIAEPTEAHVIGDVKGHNCIVYDDMIDTGGKMVDAAKALKVHPFRVKLAMQNARKFSNNSLKSAYLGLAEIEEKLKTSSQNPELLFQLFLTKYAYKK